MARIIVGSWMVRYPLGGNLSWALQHLIGLKELGHEVYLVEKYVYENSCYNPVTKEMTNDPSYGLMVVDNLLKQHGLEGRWCFVQKGEIYHGLSKQKVEEVFRTADLYIDSGANNAWAEESMYAGCRVLIDGDPGFTQFKYAKSVANGISIPKYDHYFTNGKNVGTTSSIIPAAGINWKPFYSPVCTSLFGIKPFKNNSPLSTVMNWQSFESISYNGKNYGHKDIEFEKYMCLPQMVGVPMEVAVSGKDVPHSNLQKNGWVTKNAQEVTISFESFREYLYDSRGEFSVCKNVYVSSNSGWFSDKSAAYLACGRPVILQETGFSNHLPMGEGLFAFSTVEEAKAAIEHVCNNYDYHSKKAFEIAKEYFEGSKVFQAFLNVIGF
jgi:hypothetical protein